MAKDVPIEYLRPLVTGWVGKIEAAHRYQESWRDTANECKMFFNASTGFMWDPAYRKKFWEGNASPRFRITISKAFELVAIFGPSLFFQMPHRQVAAQDPMEFDPAILGDPEDPEVQQQLQQIIQQQQQETTEDDQRAHLLDTWLNYTSREQSGGGLEEHALLALTDALVTGRGCLWPAPYAMPESDSRLTGCFFDESKNLLIDPDFNSLANARVIYRRRVMPIWQVERKFKLEKGSLEAPRQPGDGVVARWVRCVSLSTART